MLAMKVYKKSAIKLAKNLVPHERMEHIDVCFHFIREYVKEGDAQMSYAVSRDQVTTITDDDWNEGWKSFKFKGEISYNKFKRKLSEIVSQLRVITWMGKQLWIYAYSTPNGSHLSQFCNNRGFQIFWSME